MSGQANEVKEFKNKVKAKDTALSLDMLVPTPPELLKVSSPPTIVSERNYKQAVANVRHANKEYDIHHGDPITKQMSADFKKRFGADNWYDWCRKHWGTKWDVDAEIADEEPGCVEYMFDSAWSPPVEWLEAVAKQYPSLSFTLSYEEPGMGFAGEVAFEHGVEKYHHERDMEEDDEPEEQ